MRKLKKLKKIIMQKSSINPTATIKTNERIFKILTHEGELIFCNLDHLKVHHLEEFRKIWNICNGEFRRIGKIQLTNMIKAK